MHPRWENLMADVHGQRELFEGLYSEMKKLARQWMARENPGHMLNATALVHEAWIRLENAAPEQWRDRSQFFAAASEAMRRILVEAARRRSTAKRGAGAADIPLDGIDQPAETDYQRLIEVHEVVELLEAEDPVKAQIVKMRFFCGMENQEIAAILGVNEKTVRRHWTLAKIWLFTMIGGA